MGLPEKAVTCTCGHTFKIQNDRDWCDRCGKAVFYEAKRKTWHRLNTYYITLMLLLGIGFLIYFFMEMVISNLAGLK